MEFGLSRVSEMMVKSAREFCAREVPRIDAHMIEQDDYPPDLMQTYARARMLGLVAQGVRRRWDHQPQLHSPVRGTGQNGLHLFPSLDDEQQRCGDHQLLRLRGGEEEVHPAPVPTGPPGLPPPSRSPEPGRIPGRSPRRLSRTATSLC